MISYSYFPAGEAEFKCAIDRVRVSVVGKNVFVLVIGWVVPVGLPLRRVRLGNCGQPIKAHFISRPDVCEALGLEKFRAEKVGFALKYLAAENFEPELRFYDEAGTTVGTAQFDNSVPKSETGRSRFKFLRPLRRFGGFILSLLGLNHLGINVIGYIHGEFGLGESARLITKALIAAKTPVSIYTCESGNNRNCRERAYDRYISKCLRYGINLVHLNPPEMRHLDETNEEELFAGRYNICFWLWESDILPKSWVNEICVADEIWCPSEFLCQVFRRYTDKPVSRVIYPISPRINKQYNRAYFGLAENIVCFLCMFDVNSVIERKNPLGTIRAYIGAFGKNSLRTGLVIKVNNARDDVISLLMDETKWVKNVRILDKTYNREEVDSLISCCDVFVSLHRAEGFGLPIAEAMYLGKPVIATGYSANAEFMTEENSCPVGYKLVEIPQTTEQYGGFGHWAEPDIEQASELMRKLADDAALRKRIGTAAARYMRQRFSIKQSVKSLKRRIRRVVL